MRGNAVDRHWKTVDGYWMIVDGMSLVIAFTSYFVIRKPALVHNKQLTAGVNNNFIKSPAICRVNNIFALK